MPILYLDVNLGAEEKTRLVIYENDRPDELARQFALEHSKRFCDSTFIARVNVQTWTKSGWNNLKR